MRNIDSVIGVGVESNKDIFWKECHEIAKKEKKSYEETHGQVTCTVVGLRADYR